MRDLFRSLPLVLLVLAIPIVPFVLFGGTLEGWFADLLEQPREPWLAAAAVVGILTSDIFLPIPSSMVNTYAGAQLGWPLGTLAAWLGMNLGCIAGFALARWLGPSFTRWFLRPQSQAQMTQLSERFGPSIIVLTRAIPILAEACVLLLGLQRLAWRRFLPPLLLSNLGLALVYAVFGAIAAKHGSTLLALAVSVLLPVAVAAVVQRRLRQLERAAPSAPPPDPPA